MPNPGLFDKYTVQRTDGQVVYLVVMPEGGLFGVFYRLERSRDVAKAIQGTIVELPIAEDYRAEEQP
jgi:hypothetical protein